MPEPRAFKCEVCGYVHEGPEPPETCPICGVGRENFTPLQPPGAPAAAPARGPAAPAAFRCSICNYVHQGPEPPEICPVCDAARELFEPLPAADDPRGGGTPIQRVVILGAGIAGLTAAEQARRTSAEVEITLISREPEAPYYRLNLSRFLAAQVQQESLTIHPPSWYEEQRIRRVHGEAVALDRAQRQVQLRGGEVLGYDRLVLASGAHAFIPPIPGVTRQGVFALRTLEDALRIARAVGAGTRCAVIGGGLLGLEAAGALRGRGGQVTVLEGFDWLLPRQLPPRGGQLLQGYLEGLGMQVRCGARVKELVGDEGVAGVALEGGEVVDATLVVVAAGVRPNSYLARQCGLQVSGGVVVDDEMRTSDPAVLAAGDLAQHRGVLSGIWPAAYAQGVVAGINAAGGQASFTGIPPSNQLKVLGVDLFSVGQIRPADGSDRVVEQEADGAYRMLLLRDGKLLGAALYGDTTLAGQVKEAVASGIQLAAEPDLQRRLGV